jgi:hypothetical protein
MKKEFIEKFTGENVRVTMIDDAKFEGILWFVRFEHEDEKDVYSISLNTYDFEFLIEHINNIEIINSQP